MNMDLIALVLLVALVLLFVYAAVLAKRRGPLTTQQLGERAEANGMELWRIAQQMRASALEEKRTSRRDQLQLWARICESAATDHLACINAISLDSLHATGLKQPVHLGDFTGNGNRRRNPPLQSVADMFLRGRRHG